MKFYQIGLSLLLLLIGRDGLAISLVGSSAPKLFAGILNFNRSQQDKGRATLYIIANGSLRILDWLLRPLLVGLLTITKLWPEESWPLAFQQPSNEPGSGLVLFLQTLQISQ